MKLDLMGDTTVPKVLQSLHLTSRPSVNNVLMVFKYSLALAIVAQLVGMLSHNQRVVGSIMVRTHT